MGGEQRAPKNAKSASATGAMSWSGTPKEAAERPTVVGQHRAVTGHRGQIPGKWIQVRTLRNEIPHLRRIELHELVRLVHTRIAIIGRERGAALHRAAQQGAEIRVQVRHQQVLVRVGAVGGLVLLQGRGSAAVEEVEGDAGGAAAVGAGEGAGEVGEEVYGSVVVGAGGEDAGDGDAGIGGCVWVG